MYGSGTGSLVRDPKLSTEGWLKRLVSAKPGDTDLDLDLDLGLCSTIVLPAVAESNDPFLSSIPCERVCKGYFSTILHLALLSD